MVTCKRREKKKRKKTDRKISSIWKTKTQVRKYSRISNRCESAYVCTMCTLSLGPAVCQRPIQMNAYNDKTECAQHSLSHAYIENNTATECVRLRIDMFFIWHWKAAKFLYYTAKAGINDVARIKSSVISGKRAYWVVFSFLKFISRWVHAKWILFLSLFLSHCELQHYHINFVFW